MCLQSGGYARCTASGASAHVGKLYFIPPGSVDAESSELIVSKNNAELVAISGASQVRLAHLEIIAGRGSALTVDGHDVTLERLKIHNMGVGGIYAGGSDITIAECELAWIGGTALSGSISTVLTGLS